MAADEDQRSVTSQTSNGENLFVEPAEDDMVIDADTAEPPAATFDASTDNNPAPFSHISDKQSEMEVMDSEPGVQNPVDDAENKRMLRELALQKQKQMTAKFRTQQAVKTAGAASDEEHEPNGVTHAAPGNSTKRVKNARGKDAASARFEKLKQTFQKKQAAGKLTEEDEIEFMKAESEESARLKKLVLDEEFDKSPSPADSDDGGLFVEEGPIYSALRSDDGEPPSPPKKGRKRKGADDAENEKPRKANKTTKKSGKKDRKVAGTDYTEGDVENVMKSARQQTKGSRKPKQAAASKAGKAKKAQSTMANLSSLCGTNVFEDAARVINLPAQPEFEEGREGGTRQKSKALKQLISSVPTESKKTATADKKALELAIKDFSGNGSVYPAAEGTWGVKGLRATLKHYQLLGAAFMRRRECASEQPRGGILADEMGLGKTIMMLANIVNGKPNVGKKPKTTLIVASPALVSQWAREIRKHCQTRRENKHGIGVVLEQRAGHRIKEEEAEEVFENADIVLTTYHEVMRSYPKATIPTELVTAAQKDAWWKQFYAQNKGILHSIKWHRVVLDEAQAIKNHKSHTSLACRALSANHYWAITGTPVMNNIKEFYSYLRLIREPNTGSFRIFCANFCHPDDEDGLEKLNVFLRKVMVRRTHSDTLFNAKLLDLPIPHESTLWLEFSDIERQIYEIIKKRFVERINKMAKQDGLQKNFSHIWTMILRLRQICGHILQIEGTLIDLLERADFECLNALTTAEETSDEEGEALLKHLRHALRSNPGVKEIEGGLTNSVLTEHESVPLDVTKATGDEGEVGNKHGIFFRFRKYLDSLVKSEHWEAIKQRTTCCGCRQPPRDPHVTSCFHIYCLDCLGDLSHFAARRGLDQAKCTECGEAYTGTQACEDLDAFENRETSTSTTSAQKTKVRRNQLDDSWLTVNGEVLPSAKTRAVKAQILNWIEEQENVKIVVYTQFLDIVRILAKVCATEGWPYVLYTGAMSHDARDKAIVEFSNTSGMKIMLASLKCGGQGLNLTVASRVICIDPWWNVATENQAFARVYRIGQTQETKFLRLVIKNTIDAAMMATKERKQIDIDAVMQTKGKLDVRELMRLFGKVGEDDDGHPFIFAEGADCYDENDPDRLVDAYENDEMAMMGNEA